MYKSSISILSQPLLSYKLCFMFETCSAANVTKCIRSGSYAASHYEVTLINMCVCMFYRNGGGVILCYTYCPLPEVACIW